MYHGSGAQVLARTVEILVQIKSSYDRNSTFKGEGSRNLFKQVLSSPPVSISILFVTNSIFSAKIGSRGASEAPESPRRLAES